MRDLKLDAVTHDLVIENHDLQIIDDLDWLATKLKARLLFLSSEWFLNTSLGIIYLETTGRKNSDILIIDNMIKATIQETEHIIEILEYNSNFNNTYRKLTVSFTVKTDYGNITLNEVI